MKQTSKLVLSLLFAKVAAQTDDSMPLAAQDPTLDHPVTPATGDFVEDIQQQSRDIFDNTRVESPLHSIDIKIMANNYFSLYANGVPIGQQQGNYMTDNEFHPQVRENDTIAIDIKGMGVSAGNFIGSFNGMETSVEDWVCKDVEDESQIPDGWNMNHYDDQTWEHAVQVSGNSVRTSAWYGFTNPLYSETASFLWGANPYSNHQICRLNFLDFEVRNKADGECDAEMQSFQALLNEMILHHQSEDEEHRQEIVHWTENLAFASQTITDLEGQLFAAHELQSDTIDNHAQLVEDLKEEFRVEMEELKSRLSSECATAIGEKEDEVILDFEGQIDVIRNEHATTVVDLGLAHDEAKATALREAREAHDIDVAEQIRVLNEEFTINLQAELDSQAGTHSLELSNELAAMSLRLTTKFDFALKTNNEEWEARVELLTAQWQRDSEEKATVYGAEIDRLTRKHDYLYESCTTVQVVDGELVIN